MTQLSDVSLPSRVAADDEGVGFDELGLAARNHGMPLELMRHDVTPLGAHYLLTHYDIPHADVTSWR
ncbi:MAG TPA: sulfite oxidase, partial [Actinomycetes bacterium]